MTINVIKKKGNKEVFNPEKIKRAVRLSAQRANVTLTEEEEDDLIELVEDTLKELNTNNVSVYHLHTIVEQCLKQINIAVAQSYIEYRNFKITFAKIVDETYKKDKSIRYIGERDRSNANTDSTLISTKRSVVYSTFNEQLYLNFFLTGEEYESQKDGYIYIHDKGARRDTWNCCLFDMWNVLKGGFMMGNIPYNEPKTLDVAFDVMADVILNSASQQYGGHTTPEVDKGLVPYAIKSFSNYVIQYLRIKFSLSEALSNYEKTMREELAEFLSNKNIITTEKQLIDYVNDYINDPWGRTACKENFSKDVIEEAVKDSLILLQREFEQGFQAIEYKMNSVSSSRGDYPFTTMSFGLSRHVFGKMCNVAILKVRREGQGKKGKKKSVLFPKLVFLYDKNLHGKGKELYWLYKENAILCSSQAMYPDYLSLTGNGGLISEVYKKYGIVISPMGCRAFLSIWWERGGIEPADENDKPIFVGRGNMGPVSLNLPMIYMKAKEENKDFYEVLDYYLELIRGLSKRTIEYLGNMQASTNPLAFCEGGILGGNLKPTDKIAPCLKSFTISFGYTALNELQELYNNKSLVEDKEFALKTLKYINDYITRIKKEDKILYAIYATPAESLCETQVKQFRAKYGVIKNVSDKDYFTNSFHCHVSENITPMEKQNIEKDFWNYTQGGRIQYCRHRNQYNIDAMEAIITEAMENGFYEGVNFELSFCEDCGYHFLEGTVCPKCNSTRVTCLSRVCGYLGYSLINGETRLNHGKMNEIHDRISM